MVDGEMVVVVRSDRAIFSVLGVKVKVEPGSVLFMLSLDGEDNIRLKLYVRGPQTVHIFVCVPVYLAMPENAWVWGQSLSKCDRSCLDLPCFALLAKLNQAE